MALRLISAKDVLGMNSMLSLQDIGEDEHGSKASKLIMVT